MKIKPGDSFYKYSEYKPPAALSAYVEKIWVFDSIINSADEPHFRLIPDYTSSIIVIISGKNESLQMFATGPNTQNIPFETFNKQVTFGYRSFTGIIPLLLKSPPSVFLNKKIDLTYFFSGKVINTLLQKLSHIEAIKEKVNVLNNFFIPYFKNMNFAEDELTGVTNKIISSEGKLKLEDLYPSLNISPRQFQRNFTKRTGLTPKEFARVVRFHKVTRKLVKNNFRHFDTLVESGYYDQSHYYREFRELMGMLPGNFENRQKKIEYKDLLK